MEQIKNIIKSIELASKEGWITDGHHYTQPTWMGNYERTRALLDPLFWQCLGRAEGWEGTNKFFPHWEPTGKYEADKGAEMVESVKQIPLWHYKWTQFIDHLADGGTPDEFFEKLLTKQN